MAVVEILCFFKNVDNFLFIKRIVFFLLFPKICIFFNSWFELIYNKYTFEIHFHVSIEQTTKPNHEEFCFCFVNTFN